MTEEAGVERISITGVLSTGIYCLPWCRARKPKPENVRYFETIDEARQAGLRACKKCKPDDYFGGVDRELEELESAVNRISDQPQDIKSIAELASQARMGATKFFAAVRRHYHSSPADLIARRRIRMACERLLQTEESVSGIAFGVGFDTLSTFYEYFGGLTGLAPLQYRKLPTSTSFSITLPDQFHSSVVLGYFGRDPESVSERVEGFQISASANFSGRPAILNVRFEDGRADCEVIGVSALEAHAAVVRMIGLPQDPVGFELHADRMGHGRFVEGRRGLRMPLTLTPFDGVIWAIVGQQVNLRFAYALRRRLLMVCGRRLSDTLIAPPSPVDVAGLEVEDLLPLQFSRRKAEYLIGLSRQIAEGKMDLDVLANGSATRAEKVLLNVRGLGPWSVHYLMMRALGFADCLPVGDTGLTAALKRYFDLEIRPGVPETRALMEAFSPYRSLATFHLWQSLKFES